MGMVTFFDDLSGGYYSSRLEAADEKIKFAEEKIKFVDEKIKFVDEKVQFAEEKAKVGRVHNSLENDIQ
jgi:hypothetical protein